MKLRINTVAKRDDLRHLKWTLINKRGLTPEQASERIGEAIVAERRDKQFNEKNKMIKKDLVKIAKNN